MAENGRPGLPRYSEREFWRQVGQGLSTADAAAATGVSEKSGSRWFRKGGGMPTIDLAEPSGRYLSFAEREDIAIWNASGVSIREIARQLGRAPSTISRELRRNSPAQGPRRYRASKAQVRADSRARRPQDRQADHAPTVARLRHRAAVRTVPLVPGADLGTAGGRLPRRSADAHQPRVDLPGALRPGPR